MAPPLGVGDIVEIGGGGGPLGEMGRVVAIRWGLVEVELVGGERVRVLRRRVKRVAMGRPPTSTPDAEQPTPPQ